MSVVRLYEVTAHVVLGWHCDGVGLNQYSLAVDGQQIPSEAETQAKPLPFPSSCVTVPSYEVMDTYEECLAGKNYRGDAHLAKGTN